MLLVRRTYLTRTSILPFSKLCVLQPSMCVCAFVLRVYKVHQLAIHLHSLLHVVFFKMTFKGCCASYEKPELQPFSLFASSLMNARFMVDDLGALRLDLVGPLSLFILVHSVQILPWIVRPVRQSLFIWHPHWIRSLRYLTHVGLEVSSQKLVA